MFTVLVSTYRCVIKSLIQHTRQVVLKSLYLPVVLAYSYGGASLGAVELIAHYR